MPSWFYKKDERIIGPVSKQELDFLATEGRIKGSTLIRFGDRGEWKRYRPAKASSPVAAITTAVNPQSAIDAPEVPSEADGKASSGPPALTTDSDRTRRQAAIGGILALLVLLLLWFFWTQYSG